MKKNLLITGGLGYIGSHAVVAFEGAGYKTVIVDNLSNTTLKQGEGIEKILGYRPDFFKVDLRDKDSLESIFQKYSFDGVIHFAGGKAIGESCEKPLAYFDNNIVGSLRLFECMEKFDVKKIIFSSSATVYKELKDKTPPQSPSMRKKRGLSEIDPVGDCSNPYGTTKFLLEQILKDLAKFSAFQVMNLRYFNPIGAHESGYIGEDPQGIPNNLLPYIMKVAIGELETLSIFGNDYDTIDGTGVRDYIDVNDLIDGHVLAYKKISSFPTLLGRKEEKFSVYNLGVGKGVSVLEMVNIARKVTGKDISCEIVEKRAGDLGEVYCEPTKAKKELDWTAKVSLEESLIMSWRFYNR